MLGLTGSLGRSCVSALALASGTISVSALAADDSPPPAAALISRELLFGNPDKAGPQISPDGKRLAYLAAVDGVMNVWVGPADKPGEAKPVTKDTKRGIREFFWAYTCEHILYAQDTGGDENWHAFATNLTTLETRDLTPFEKIAARPAAVSHRFPDEVMISINNRDPRLHDVFRVNVRTGESKMVQQNDGFVGFEIDDDYSIRFASRVLPTGGQEVLKADGKGGFSEFMKVEPDDAMTTGISGFDQSGKHYYLMDSRNRNTAALFSVDAESGKSTLIAEDAKADAGAVMMHPTTNAVQAVAFNYDRNNWKVIDPSIQPDFDYLKTVAAGEYMVGSRTLDDQTWIVSYSMDSGPARYYRYDRKNKKAELLFTARPKLEGQPLVKMHPVIIPSRDGMNLVSYLTLPPGCDSATAGKPATPQPMVLLVHGGPWARDNWGYNPMHQWLANRGYAVLSVNFRGSTGFGKTFLNAANQQWARKMHDDLVDAVKWSTDNKVADPKRVAIMGGSYGGYATLVGLTETPDLFACGVDIVGPSNLNTLLASVPAYWKPMLDMMKMRVGNPDTEDGKKLLEERSPLNFVTKIKRPLLIGQGANDPRVKQAEADQIVRAMTDKQIPVTYVLYPDEGHGFQRPENRMSFNAVVEAFLGQHLGGRVEPIGDDFKGASIQVPTGAGQLPGLKEALAGTPQ